MGKRIILLVLIVTFSSVISAGAPAPANGVALQSILDQMDPDVSIPETDQIHFTSRHRPRPCKASGSFSQHPSLDSFPVGSKRNVGLDFSDYVTDDENRRGNGNSNSAEGGRRRYWRNG